MRKVILKMNEQEKYENIKLTSEGKISKRRCSIKLGISTRQVNRLLNKYKREGKKAFIHGNRDRKPSNKIPLDFSNKIIHLAMTKYKGDKENYLICNYKHFKTLLAKEESIVIPYSTLYDLLIKEKIRSPKLQRKTRRKFKKEEILASKASKCDEVTLEKKVEHLLALEDAHPRQEKAKYFGELIQMDACSQRWNDDLFMHLHLAIDNATGMPVGAYFDHQETLNGYYHVFKQILRKYGIPAKFLTDKRTVFTYESKSRKKDEDDTLTQFAFACKNLGVELTTTSVAQSKGQIERYNGIFQDRLKAELTLKNINTIEMANEYLINVFIPEYIKEFSLSNKGYNSVFADIEESSIDYYLSKVSRRLVDKGCSISFKNQYYAFYDENDKRIYPSNKTKCIVVETFNGELYGNVFDKTYVLKKINKNKDVSSTFDEGVKCKNKKKNWIPPMDHPWRYPNYDSFQEAFKNNRYSLR